MWHSFIAEILAYTKVTIDQENYDGKKKKDGARGIALRRQIPKKWEPDSCLTVLTVPGLYFTVVGPLFHNSGPRFHGWFLVTKLVPHMEVTGITGLISGCGIRESRLPNPILKFGIRDFGIRDSGFGIRASQIQF